VIDPGYLVGLIGLLGGGASGLGALLVVRQRRETMTAEANKINATAENLSATADSRIMDAVAGIVEQTSTQIPVLMERLTRVESANEHLRTDNLRLQGSLDRVIAELNAERDELELWRRWGAAQMAWAGQAVRAIKDLGVEIPDPPSPPDVWRRQTIVETGANGSGPIPLPTVAPS
jgi:hypothetical protein